jgi:Spy/CpxP family protein refolding chaperone
MRFTRVVPFALALGMAFTGFGFAVAQQAPPAPQRPGPMGMGMGGRMGGPGGLQIPLGALNLTDQQKQQVQKLMAANRPAQPPQTPDLEQQLRQAIFGDPPNPNVIEPLKAQIAAAQADQLAKRVALEMGIAQILTADQRKQVADMPAGPGRGRGGMMGRGPGGPGRSMQQKAPGAGKGPGKGSLQGA